MAPTDRGMATGLSALDAVMSGATSASCPTLQIASDP